MVRVVCLSSMTPSRSDAGFCLRMIALTSARVCPESRMSSRTTTCLPSRLSGRSDSRCAPFEEMEAPGYERTEVRPRESLTGSSRMRSATKIIAPVMMGMMMTRSSSRRESPSFARSSSRSRTISWAISLTRVAICCLVTSVRSISGNMVKGRASGGRRVTNRVKSLVCRICMEGTR